MNDNNKLKFRAKRKYADGEVDGYYFYDIYRNKHFLFMQDMTGAMRESEIDADTLRIIHNTNNDFKNHVLVGNIVHECLSNFSTADTNKLNSTKEIFHKLYDEYIETIEDQKKDFVWEMIMNGIRVIQNEKDNKTNRGN